MEAPRWQPSPNCGARRDGATPDLVVIHYTAMETVEAAAEVLCDPAAEVSAHYLISETGEIIQMVAEADRAWHAGAGAWGDIADVNSRSIGIELANDALSPFPEPQMAALEGLLGEIMARWSVPPAGVIAHSDCAPGRKIDPGARFDWTRLARQGLAASAVPRADVVEAGSDAAFVAAMGRAGYTGHDDPEVLLQALRLRHRPAVTGARDKVDMALALGLGRVDAEAVGA